MEITLTFYSALGEQISVLESGLRRAGLHKAEFTAPKTIPSGVYFYELKTPEGNAQGRMLFAK